MVMPVVIKLVGNKPMPGYVSLCATIMSLGSCRCINTLQLLFIFAIDVQNNVNLTVSPGRTEDDGKVYPSSLICGVPALVDRSIDCDVERSSRLDALCTVYEGAIIKLGVVAATANIKSDKDIITKGRAL